MMLLSSILGDVCAMYSMSGILTSHHTSECCWESEHVQVDDVLYIRDLIQLVY